ncbi:hypothetical protein HKBW3S43_01836 [Candidatus Hakubella thermalkaliphila]|uniref:Uncharacterized protein n=1 Tax=Candidatus Hakubella thermalkaliphila TaxID=2754717 RepID=A0A6V8P4C1_9ACTN|nr:DUF5647 family protein [Candidatus Hakubella thermalkaliphila]GFP21052.1 hypothetical protein HKBW3S06_00278 [Candidatus Hakubella thermalkaliphila]GFP24963.1 hypothetical protein HKBW3S25_00401 [Candidatus Hakubella thermalkaliphila]GFP27469.1 hypothetical protein HKBW3S33_00882 [Candidatus Hakubella thermalkaliphila]GFP36048.1 hypothetical protein HKBW3S43_01836 [Candidatus Hakubella thermalkaliphila]GFP42092.1 hypothetical protein HKBW3C_01218 [Candidatus Hakubella thermalkaliphila]
MTEKELFEKNQKLSTEFDLYLLDHPELLDKIPENALIVLLPEFDQELKQKNLEMARLHREKEQPLVYVKVDKMRASRLEGLQLEVA